MSVSISGSDHVGVGRGVAVGVVTTGAVVHAAVNQVVETVVDHAVADASFSRPIACTTPCKCAMIFTPHNSLLYGVNLTFSPDNPPFFADYLLKFSPHNLSIVVEFMAQ